MFTYKKLSPKLLRCYKNEVSLFILSPTALEEESKVKASCYLKRHITTYPLLHTKKSLMLFQCVAFYSSLNLKLTAELCPQRADNSVLYFD